MREVGRYRALRKNMQRMMYSLYLCEKPEYECDDSGNVVYDTIDGENIPRETGVSVAVYGEPVEFWANIAGNRGETQAKAFGLSVGDYDAVVYTPKNRFPLTEGTLIWYDNEPDYKDGHIDPDSADFIVIRVPVCLDEANYLLKRVIK